MRDAYICAPCWCAKRFDAEQAIWRFSIHSPKPSRPAAVKINLSVVVSSLLMIKPCKPHHTVTLLDDFCGAVRCLEA